jgi:hypothetical protein
MKEINFVFKNKTIYYQIPNDFEVKSISFVNNGYIFHTYIPADPKPNTKLMFSGHSILDIIDGKDIKIIANKLGHKGIVNTDLFFIHPMKTGGSSIVSSGYDYNILWGDVYKKLKTRHTYDHHQPSSYFMERDDIKNKKLFTVIRSPYNRVISYFKNTVNSKEELNNKVWNSFKTNLYKEGMAPCYDYITHGNKQVIPHILRYEDGLKKSFDNLMKENNCIVRLTNDKALETNYKKYTPKVSDLDHHNISYINSIYEKDFKSFNYPTLKLKIKI